MNKIGALFLLSFVFQSCISNTEKVDRLSIKEVENTITYSIIVKDKVSHEKWDLLLKKNVDEDGFVNYSAFKNDEQQLKEYLDYLSSTIPDENWTVQEQLAYFINLYNAATVALIINNYPLESIKDIKNPWDKKFIILGNESYSLGEIEHDILRKMNESRIHFAINCASYSCPNLLNEAFTASKIESQLAKVTFSFINGNKNDISPDNPQLSKIFKWFKNDFLLDGERDLIGFINQYSDIKIKKNADIDYRDYNWSLNEKK